jgi:hypothetical protein
VKQSKFLNVNAIYLLISLSIIPIIILIFKNIHPKNLAALFAGSVFIFTGFIVLFLEFKNNRKKIFSSFSFWGALGFLLFFSLPMFSVRILNYDIDFENLTILFMPAPQFHKVSNYGFMLMVLFFIIEWLKNIKSTSDTNREL